MATGNRTTPKDDAYKRGRSGYSVKDEKDSKQYGKDVYAATPAKVTDPKRESQKARDSNRKLSRDKIAPENYLRNVKSKEGRAINEANVRDTKQALEKKLKGKSI
jgi:hypothetical protein